MDTGVVSSPRYWPSFLWRIGSNFPTSRGFSSNVVNSSSRASAISIFIQEKNLKSIYSLKLEPTKLILVPVDTVTTGQAAGGGRVLTNVLFCFRERCNKLINFRPCYTQVLGNERLYSPICGIVVHVSNSVK